ncbi:MAG TPA: fasciclin domain-containing protein [Ilumatobacteraceae bacterium]
MTVSGCGGSDKSASTSPTTIAATSASTSTSLVTTTVVATGGSTGGSAGATTGATSPAGSGVPTSSLPTPTKSILQLATEEGELKTFLGLLDTAGLTATLQGDGPFTLIAPTDLAFKKMDPTTLDRISKSHEVLTELLDYHLVDRRVTTKDVTAGFVTTVEGSPIALQATTKLPTLNGLTVVKAARGTNGTILVIDSVLLPIDIKLP